MKKNKIPEWFKSFMSGHLRPYIKQHGNYGFAVCKTCGYVEGPRIKLSAVAPCGHYGKSEKLRSQWDCYRSNGGFRWIQYSE